MLDTTSLVAGTHLLLARAFDDQGNVAESVVSAQGGGVVTPATCGNGVCEDGESGASCGADCCDATTSCADSYREEGVYYCRNIARPGGTTDYHWMSVADASQVCGAARFDGTTHATCGGATWTCCQGTWKPGAQCD
jgi:hypothetical protein